MQPARQRAVVVGGGLSGLTAAHRLCRAGLQVTLLEQRAQLGGRLGSERVGGVSYVPLGHTTCSRAPQLAALLRELGTRADVQRRPLSEIDWGGGRRPRRRALAIRHYLGGRPLRGARLRRLQWILHHLVAPVDPMRPEQAARLDDRSVAEMCGVYLGRRAREELFEPLLAVHFGLEAGDTSRQLALGWMDEVGDLRLDRLTGLPSLVDGLSASLADVRTGVRVGCVDPGGRRVGLASGEAIAADIVVLAVRPSDVCELVEGLPFAQRPGLQAQRVQPGLALATLSPRPAASAGPGPAAAWWPRRGSPLLAGWLDLSPREVHTRVRLWVCWPGFARAAGAQPEPRLAERLLREVSRLEPELRRSLKAWQLWRSADVARIEVGHYRSLARLRASRAADPGRLILAGGELVGPDVEAAIASGERAAAEALQALRTA